MGCERLFIVTAMITADYLRKCRIIKKWRERRPPSNWQLRNRDYFLLSLSVHEFHEKQPKKNWIIAMVLPLPYQSRRCDSRTGETASEARSDSGQVFRSTWRPDMVGHAFSISIATKWWTVKMSFTLDPLKTKKKLNLEMELRLSANDVFCARARARTEQRPSRFKLVWTIFNENEATVSLHTQTQTQKQRPGLASRSSRSAGCDGWLLTVAALSFGAPRIGRCSAARTN